MSKKKTHEKTKEANLLSDPIKELIHDLEEDEKDDAFSINHEIIKKRKTLLQIAKELSQKSTINSKESILFEKKYDEYLEVIESTYNELKTLYNKQLKASPKNTRTIIVKKTAAGDNPLSKLIKDEKYDPLLANQKEKAYQLVETPNKSDKGYIKLGESKIRSLISKEEEKIIASRIKKSEERYSVLSNLKKQINQPDMTFNEKIKQALDDYIYLIKYTHLATGYDKAHHQRISEFMFLCEQLTEKHHLTDQDLDALMLHIHESEKFINAFKIYVAIDPAFISFWEIKKKNG